MLGVELVAVYGFVSYMGMRNNGFIRAIFAKERIIDKAMDKNRDIVEKQQKLFYVNEQLGIKRIQLEAANKKINDNIIEMNLQNDMLDRKSTRLNSSHVF